MTLSWIDGHLTPSPRAVVTASDRGFLYGDGLFETIRLYGGRPFLLDRHLDRLAAGAAALGMAVPYTRGVLRDALTEVVQGGAIGCGVARLTVSRGAGERGFVPAEDLRPTVVITASGRLPYGEPLYLSGLRAVLLPWPRNERSPLVRIKSLSCAENVAGAMLARRAGANEGLFLNTMGFLAEGTMSNLFLVLDGDLLTPPVEAGLLPGIIRDSICRCFDVGAKLLSLGELRAADEAFLTNSVLGVAPLVQVDGSPLGDGRPGPVTRRIMEWYLAETRCLSTMDASDGATAPG